MFTTNLNFTNILSWFQKSRYDYMLLFLPSCDTKDRKLDDYVIRNQYSIDWSTGKKIAYIAYQNAEFPCPIMHVKEHQLPPEAIRTHVRVSMEVCNFFHFGQYKLPALILISKTHDYELFPIKSEIDFDSYFTPIGIVTSFIDEYERVYWEKHHYESLDDEKKRLINESNSLNEEIRNLEEYLRKYENDKELALRIDTNYRRLFNHLKSKRVKQNIFEEVFAKELDEDIIVDELYRLGLDEDLKSIVVELINDLKKVRNFRKFQAQYGCVSKQIERLFDLCRQEINERVKMLNNITNEVLDIEQEETIAPEKIKEYDEEQNTILSNYGRRLNNTIFVTNGTEILQNSLHDYSKVLIDILTTVKEKSNKINVIIERLDKQIDEEGFDIFISTKSEDYKKAFDVYNYLCGKGYKTFLADPVLREIGTDYYGYLIRRIVNKCHYMIVFASNVKYMTTTYVSAEWNQFLDELSSGIKEGKLFSIIPPTTPARMLPPGLSTRQFFTMDNYKDDLLQYFKP